MMDVYVLIITYRDEPTDVGILVYSTEEKAEAAGAKFMDRLKPGDRDNYGWYVECAFVDDDDED